MGVVIDGVLVGLALTTVLFTLVSLSIVPLIFARIWRRHCTRPSFAGTNREDLLVTARNSGGTWLLTWGYYSALTGAWILPAAGHYGHRYGLCGVLFFAIALGLQPVISAALARAAYQQLRESHSLPQSLGNRYGRSVELYTTAMAALMSGLCLAAEYTAIAGIFHVALGISRLVVLAAAVAFSIAHTFTGGALVGLFTHQFNGLVNVFSSAALLAFFLHTAQDFKPPPPQRLVFGSPNNTSGSPLSLLASMQLNVTMACFLESLWQKHCACKRKSDLWPSAMAGGGLVAALAVLFGAAGMLAAWGNHAGRLSSGAHQAAGTWFLALDRRWRNHTIVDIWQPYHYWYGVTLLLHVAVASQVAVRSWNNALLSIFFGAARTQRRQLLTARACVVALNLLALLIAGKDMAVLSLHHIAITFGACLLCPLFFSICNTTLFRHASASDILLPALAGLLACCICGMVSEHNSNHHRSMTALVLRGLCVAFYDSGARWPFVLVSVLVPCVVYGYMILPKLLQDDMELFEAVVE